MVDRMSDSCSTESDYKNKQRKKDRKTCYADCKIADESIDHVVSDCNGI